MSDADDLRAKVLAVLQSDACLKINFSAAGMPIFGDGLCGHCRLRANAMRLKIQISVRRAPMQITIGDRIASFLARRLKSPFLIIRLLKAVRRSSMNVRMPSSTIHRRGKASKARIMNCGVARPESLRNQRGRQSHRRGLLSCAAFCDRQADQPERGQGDLSGRPRRRRLHREQISRRLRGGQ